MLLLGCTGTIGEPVGRSRQVGCGDPDVGQGPLHRLTRDEYDNTVRDLLGDESRPARAFPPDSTLLGFASGDNVSAMLLRQYMNAADSLAATAASHLDRLTSCDRARDGEERCARQLIEDLGPRAYRRPLTAEEASELYSLYATARGAGDGFEAGIELVVSALLQSPNFLYRVEMGAPSQAGSPVAEVSPYELASRLSYFLWSSMPDDELFAAAANRELETPEEIEAQARRMLDDPRAHDALARFYEQWLGLERLESLTKDDRLFGEFAEHGLGRKMHAETLAFVSHVMWEDDARIETLLTAPYTFASGPLAEIYGVDAPAEDTVRRIDLDPSERSGLLTQAGLLSLLANPNQGSPVHRGKFVRERLLCEVLQSPPDTNPETGEPLEINPPDLEPGMTTRERFAAHWEDPFCRGCHLQMDLIGLGFEHYDAIGRYRTTEGGRPIDATGVVHGTREGDVPFDGVPELAAWLAQAEQVHDCMTRQWFRYALGRHETDADDCSIREALTALEAGRGDLRELVVATTKTYAFRHRRVVTTGEAP